MTSVTIYHNPGCSKSRQTLALLEAEAVDVEIIEYLNAPADADELRSLASKLGLGIADIVRTGENAYKSLGMTDPTDDELIAAMVRQPILMQRPIVVNGDKARIGRPPESVLEIL